VLKDSLNVTKPVELVAGFSEYYKRSMTAIIEARETTDEKKRQAQNELAEEVRNLKALTEMSMPYTSVHAMLDDFVLNTPAADDEEDYITISTIHSVKGLEFHTVFFIDPVMGVIPHTEQDLPDTREDLRCVYVALTRAKEILYITYARFSMGQEQALSCHLNKQPILDCCSVEKHLTARPDYSRQRYNSYSRNYY
jgi:DNA helicase-2/ATP-dependent DNA helicase PcrA